MRIESCESSVRADREPHRAKGGEGGKEGGLRRMYYLSEQGIDEGEADAYDEIAPPVHL